MTTPSYPGVRAAMVDALNMFLDRRHAEAYADHIVTTVEPVIRRQLAEEMAGYLDLMQKASEETGLTQAARAYEHAAATVREHA